ncbi:guanylate kinase [SAR116 cluster alpha proteobacterium HIMB100]|nr:guanylate kinase [SAR116 cluster alpha proteobacterium HIMB100]
MITRQGLMLVLSSPSGAGKTSIARELLKRDSEIIMSVSATTRQRRPGETEGKDYFFVDEQQFKTDINKGLFLEYAQVFDHYYGTPLKPVQDMLAMGRDVLFDIDWQGTQQIKAKARQDLVSVFVLPPSTAELERRLLSRAQDSAEVVAGRMARAADEMSHYPEYDYIIVNHELEASIEAVHTILRAERLRISRQAGLTEFMKQLREDSC